MYIETANSMANAILTVEYICENIADQHKDKISMLRHDIDNCLASIQTVNEMLLSENLSVEDRISLQELREKAAIELAELIKNVAPNMVF